MAGLIIRLGFNYLVILCLCLRSNRIVIYFCHCKTKISGLGNPYTRCTVCPNGFFSWPKERSVCNLKKPVVYMVFAHTMWRIVALLSDRQILYNVCIYVYIHIYLLQFQTFSAHYARHFENPICLVASSQSLPPPAIRQRDKCPLQSYG